MYSKLFNNYVNSQDNLHIIPFNGFEETINALSLKEPLHFAPLYRLMCNVDNSHYIVLDSVLEPSVLVPLGDKHLMNVLEKYSEINISDRVRKIAQLANFPYENVIYATANRFLSDSDSIKAVFIPAIPDWYDGVRDRNKQFSVKPRSKHFLTLNSSPKPHRVILVNRLLEAGLDSKCLISFNSNK